MWFDGGPTEWLRATGTDPGALDWARLEADMRTLSDARLMTGT